MPKLYVKHTSYTTLNQWIASDMESSPAGYVEIVWTGQAGFLIKAPGKLIGIDLYLSNSLAEKYAGALFPHIRMMEPPITPQELESLSLLLATHGHTDHMDMGTIMPLYSSSGAQKPVTICPRAELQKAWERGVPKECAIGLTSDETITIHNITVSALPAAHEELRFDSYGNSYALGYIIDIQGLRIFHSGDTLLYPGLEQRLQEAHIDIALLPVNGRDQYRTSHGILGNLTIEEAGTLAKQSNIPLLIPHHFGMFDFNTVSSEAITQGLQATGWNSHTSTLTTIPGLVYTVTKDI